MSKILMLLPLMAATCLWGCSKTGTAPTSNATSTQMSNAADHPDECDSRGIKVGDSNIQLRLADTDWRWNTAGAFVTLTEKGNGKDVDLVESKDPGGPSAPTGDCLRSGSYIRLARTEGSGDNRYLQAYQADDANHVTIGNHQDINAIFYVIKASDAGTPSHTVIKSQDVVLIRGVSHDPWTVAPATPTEGSAVGLDASENPIHASSWKISRKGPKEG